MPPPNAPPDTDHPRQTARPADDGKGLHARNRHRGRYDFAQLIAAHPPLAAHVARNAYGDESIDFADARAVRALNAALLAQSYGIDGWQLPERYLCPPIPGRADALHYLADLLAENNSAVIPRGAAVRVIDVGVGANAVYPLIGNAEYGWSFVGSDIDRAALAAAQKVINANAGLRAAIELRWQRRPEAIFDGIVGAGERFDLTLCNPPFHASLSEARRGSRRKWANLGHKPGRNNGHPADKPQLNFGGRDNELCCAGGETAFVGRMIAESRHYAARCLWFSSLVAKAASLPAIERALCAAGVRERRTIAMQHGQKQTRIVAWTYLDAGRRDDWNRQRATVAAAASA